MDLKLVDKSSTFHSGYGAGSGRVIREEYECPCGKGLVVYEKDDIPGFKDSGTRCHCKECSEKYEFQRGTATDIE